MLDGPLWARWPVGKLPLHRQRSPQRSNAGVFIIRIGFWVYYTIIIIRSPQIVWVIILAPVLLPNELMHDVFHGSSTETALIKWGRPLVSSTAVVTRRPLSSSFLGLPYRILNIDHKKEPLRGLWVELRAWACCRDPEA